MRVDRVLPATAILYCVLTTGCVREEKTPVKRSPKPSQFAAAKSHYPHIAAEDAFFRGIKAAFGGDNPCAIRHFTEALERDPEFAEAYLARGDCYLFESNRASAIRDLNEAIRLNPYDAGAHRRLGLAYSEAADPDTAIRSYTNAIQYGSANARTYCMRGLARASTGDYDNAVADFSESIRISSRYANAYLYRGLASERMGQDEKAQEDYHEAVKLGCCRPEAAECLLALTWARLGGRAGDPVEYHLRKSAEHVLNRGVLSRLTESDMDTYLRLFLEAKLNDHLHVLYNLRQMEQRRFETPLQDGVQGTFPRTACLSHGIVQDATVYAAILAVAIGFVVALLLFRFKGTPFCLASGFVLVLGAMLICLLSPLLFPFTAPCLENQIQMLPIPGVAWLDEEDEPKFQSFSVHKAHEDKSDFATYMTNLKRFAQRHEELGERLDEFVGVEDDIRQREQSRWGMRTAVGIAANLLFLLGSWLLFQASCLLGVEVCIPRTEQESSSGSRFRKLAAPAILIVFCCTIPVAVGYFASQDRATACVAAAVVRCEHVLISAIWAAAAYSLLANQKRSRWHFISGCSCAAMAASLLLWRIARVFSAEFGRSDWIRWVCLALERTADSSLLGLVALVLFQVGLLGVAVGMNSLTTTTHVDMASAPRRRVTMVFVACTAVLVIEVVLADPQAVLVFAIVGLGIGLGVGVFVGMPGSYSQWVQTQWINVKTGQVERQSGWRLDEVRTPGCLSAILIGPIIGAILAVLIAGVLFVLRA